MSNNCRFGVVPIYAICIHRFLRETKPVALFEFILEEKSIALAKQFR